MAEPAMAVQISTPESLAASLPHLLGFRPQESLTILCQAGGRSGLVARADLDELMHPQAVAYFAEMVQRAGKPDSVFLFVHTSAPSVNDLPQRALVESMCNHLVVHDALLVREGRMWSYLCDNPSCCPPEGRALPEATDIGAALALSGRRTFDSREEAAQAAKPPTDPDAVATFERLLGQVDMSPDVVELLLARLNDPRCNVTQDHAAQIVKGAEDLDVRDAWLSMLVDHPNAPSLMERVAALVPAPYDAAVATMLAISAYCCDGNGMLASTAIERALATDPTYSLAKLLDVAILTATPPSDVAWAVRGMKLPTRREVEE